MKKMILAPLLSAFVLPGLGQVVNGQVRKAGLLIAAISLLFLALFFKVLYDLNKFFLSLSPETYEKNPQPFSTAAQFLSRQDKGLLIILVLLLAGIWVYGVWDAFWTARKAGKVSS
jgi:ABC-type Na+ efflux pump permease subunit